jgi:hypothetical protein
MLSITPTEAQDATIAKIKLNLKLRRAQLVKYASKVQQCITKNCFNCWYA